MLVAKHTHTYIFIIVIENNKEEEIEFSTVLCYLPFPNIFIEQI